MATDTGGTGTGYKRIRKWKTYPAVNSGSETMSLGLSTKCGDHSPPDEGKVESYHHRPYLLISNTTLGHQNPNPLPT